MSLIQVFRITPQIGKYYIHAERTVRKGKYPNETYFAPEEACHYVGKLIREYHYGYGDNRTCIYYFDKNGIEIQVQLSYEGNTCFVEVKGTEGSLLDPPFSIES